MTMEKTTRLALVALTATAGLFAEAKDWPGFSRGMGIGGWLTNYKRFNVLPECRRLKLTVGDLEHFDTYITEQDIANIKAMGFDHVRLGFDQIVLEEAPGKYRERTFRKIDDFVGWCERHGLNMVLNLHKAIGNYCDIAEKVQLLDDPGLQDRFVALWLEFERRYHDRPNLAFELLNEVRNVDPEKWNALADRTLKAIRERNPVRWVVVGSIDWNSPDALAQLKTWDDERVVYTFHLYAPFEFTHQRGVLMDGPLYYNRVMEYPSKDVERYRDYQRLVNGSKTGGYEGVDEIGREYLRTYLAGARDFVRKHPDKILWNGEFGTIRHAPSASRVAYMRDVTAVCREWGIPYCVWNYLSTPNDGNRFSLVDDDTRQILSPELLKACLGEESRSPVRIALTFDDGMADHFSVVAPRLEQYGWKGLFNVITDRVGSQGVLTWDEIRSLKARGFDIGNHTLSHPNLVQLLAKGMTNEVVRQIAESRDRIARETGAAPIYFCHPYTAMNPEVNRLCREGRMVPMTGDRPRFGGKARRGDQDSIGASIRRWHREGVRAKDVLVHGITPQGGGYMPFESLEAFDDFLAQIKECVDEGLVEVVPYKDYLAEADR